MKVHVPCLLLQWCVKDHGRPFGPFANPKKLWVVVKVMVTQWYYMARDTGRLIGERRTREYFDWPAKQVMRVCGEAFIGLLCSWRSILLLMRKSALLLLEELNA